MTGPFVQTQNRLFIGERDLTGNINAGGVQLETEPQDASVFGLNQRINRPGLRSGRIEFAGFFDAAAGQVDPVLFNALRLSDQIVTYTLGNQDGDPAYLMKGAVANYAPSGTVGEMFGFSASIVNSPAHGVDSGAGPSEEFGPLLMGNLAHYGTETLTANGTAFGQNQINANDVIYAALHVIAASGSSPTLDVTIESDVSAAFSTPTTRITFTQAIAAGSEWMSALLNTSVTDDFWRATWTIGGTTPSFTFAVSFGLLPRGTIAPS